MLFEGLILNNRFSYGKEKLEVKYDDYLTFENGFLGARLSQKPESLTNSYFGSFTSKDKETKIIGSQTAGNFVSFSFEALSNDNCPFGHDLAFFYPV